MIIYPFPEVEQSKAEIRQRYRILGDAGLHTEHMVARTVATAFNVPTVIAALNRRYASWYRLSHGCPEETFESLHAFCARAQLSDSLFVIPDVRNEPLFASDPVVSSSPGVKFLAGTPLLDPDGKRLGSLCLIDYVCRDLAPAERQLLQSFAQLVSADLCTRSAARYAVRDLLEAEEDKSELYGLAMTDPLTGALNRRAFSRFSASELKRAHRHGHDLSLLVFDIDHFKQVNDTHGHAAGDDVLKALIATTLRCVRSEDLVGRLGGEEFAVLLPETSPEDARHLAERLRKEAQTLEFVSDAGRFGISISIGVSTSMRNETDLSAALERADKALYLAKSNGRNRVELSELALGRRGGRRDADGSSGSMASAALMTLR